MSQQLHSLLFTKEDENLCPHRNQHMDVYSGFIHDWQNLEVTKMSFSKWLKCGTFKQLNIIQC